MYQKLNQQAGQNVALNQTVEPDDEVPDDADCGINEKKKKEAEKKKKDAEREIWKNSRYYIFA